MSQSTQEHRQHHSSRHRTLLLITFLLLLLTVAVHIDRTTAAEFAVFKLLYDLTNQFNASIPDTNQFHSEYDFIVIGSGSGGSVMANRLTEQRDWTVLLLEAGDEESFLSDVPLTPGATQITRFNWGYRTERQPGACTGLINGVCNWPKGRALGGTSVINFLIYQRGHRSDYDEWSRAGNIGWSYAEVLPYFIKSERNGIAGLRNSPYHGRNGYLDVQYAGYKTELADAFIAAGAEFGYRHTDPNGESLMGFGRAQATMRNGRRCSAAKAFLRPVMERPNLDISMKSRVTRILIDPVTRQAYGVEFIKNRKRFRVRVRKEVILSAGTIASPQLLMLSGVGPREHLEKVGVQPIVQDLRGVGYNLQDHVAFNGLEFLVNRSVTVSEANVQSPMHILNYLYNGRGPYTIPGGAEALGFVKTWNSSYPSDYPDIEIVIGAGGLGADRSGTLRNMLGLPDEFYYKVYRNVMGKPAFGLVPVLLRPQSRGRISLKSTNPFHWPRMEPNFYTDRSDLTRLIDGVRMSIEIGKAKSFRQFGTTFHTQPFPGCEPLPFNSDAYWECCIRKYASSLQHQVGTCRMGPPTEPTAVVNPQLQVYGVRGLRVVDASIMPNIIAGHTNAAVFMIGEKAADMVKSFWLTGSRPVEFSDVFGSDNHV